jgi:soluble lytic murein transglycosylase
LLLFFSYTTGTKKFSLYILSSLLISLSSFAAHPPLTIKNKLELRKIRTTSNDLKVAKELDRLFHSLRKGRSHRVYPSAQFILKKLTSKSVFIEYRDDLKNIRDIFSTRSKNKLKTLNKCLSSYGHKHIEEETTYFLKKLKLKVRSFCFKALVRTKSNHKVLYEAYLRNLDLLFKRRSRLNFPKFYNALDITRKIHLSSAIGHYAIQNQRLPGQRILSTISISKELTDFIQDKNLLSRKDHKYFEKELRSQIKSFQSTFFEQDSELLEEKLKSAFTFYENNKSFISDKKAWKIFLQGGKKFLRNNNLSMALDMFKFSEIAATGSELQESNYQGLFSYILNSDYTSALEFLKTNIDTSRPDSLGPKLRYWSAHVLEKNNEIRSAKSLYLAQVKLNPLNYYSILSLKRLRKISPQINHELLFEDVEKPLTSLQLTDKAKNTLSKMMAFSKARSYKIFNFYVKDIFVLSSKSNFLNSRLPASIQNSKSFIYSSLISFLYDKKQYLDAFKLSYQGLSRGELKLTKSFISNLYPVHFLDLINKSKRKVDPLLILSLIRQESAFNPRAKSIVGARGLMQLMPRTARQYQKISNRSLFKPRPNIAIGIKYFEKLLKQNDGNIAFALAAYNAGEGNLRKWKRKIFKPVSLEKNLELIPFKETRNYVKLIYRNYYFYNLILKDNDLASRDLEENLITALKR